MAPNGGAWQLPIVEQQSQRGVTAGGKGRVGHHPSLSQAQPLVESLRESIGKHVGMRLPSALRLSSNQQKNVGASPLV